MSSKHQAEATFLDRYLNGEAPAEDIDDYVDRWHSESGRQQIYDFLGLSRDEYALRLSDPDALPHIPRARREHQPLALVMASKQKKTSPADRSADQLEKKSGSCSAERRIERRALFLTSCLSAFVVSFAVALRPVSAG